MASRLDGLLSTLTDQGLFSGSVLVARDGQVLFSQGYGSANPQLDVANTPQTKFPLTLLTKQFTAAAILLLVDDGRIDVHASVCDYLPNCPSTWQPVTLKHLLTETSGLAGYEVLEAFKAIRSTATTTTEIEATFRNEPLAFTPGSRWGYSQANYFVLGEVIEQVSGERYGDFIRERIFEPLGMTNSGYDENTEGRAVVSYGEQDPWLTPSALFSVAGLYSTVEDLYRWDQALDTDQLLSEASRQAMFTGRVDDNPLFGDDPDKRVSYGWLISSDHGHRRQYSVGTSNLVPVFPSTLIRYPDDRLTIILLSNYPQLTAESVVRLVLAQIYGPDWLDWQP